MSRKNRTYISEEFRISLNLTLKKFRQNEKQKELEFPSSFTSGQRAFIHRFCAKLGLKSKSKGSGPNRFLTVYKKEGSTIVQADASFHLGKTSRHHVVGLLQRFPLTARERQDLLPPTERDRILLQLQDSRDLSSRSVGRLSSGAPQIPPCCADLDSLSFQQSLPIWNCRDEIIQSMIRHQVILISGETGSGKSTQVPQYLLDHCGLTGVPCRVICTQPRRIAAVSLAERVALERGEKVGITVGFKIRLESRVSSKTILTYCTVGVLLRTLMCGDAFASTITHIIVDELHVRDKYTDFLLIILRDLLLKFRNLKLILMSATLDTQLFVKYFGGCPFVEVPGRLFDVKPYFLEDVLKSTGYTTKAMKKYQLNASKIKSQQKHLQSWCMSVSGDVAAGGVEKSSESLLQRHQMDAFDNVDDIDPCLAAKMDQLLHDAWMSGTSECFSSLLNLLLSYSIPVDWQHREASVSPLMVAAGRGNIDAVEQLLNLGANIHLKSSNDWCAIDFAKNFGHKAIENLLQSYNSERSVPSPTPPEGNNEADISPETKLLLDAYQSTVPEDKVDLDLIFYLIKNLCYTKGEGAVLVFLPGYDDIVTLRDKILLQEKNFPDQSRLIVFTLHSQMQNSDQKRVFKPVPQGVRKVILSTNIAETSITINDVVFVIDSGKAKEKTFDAIIGTTQLTTSWISQATALQRRGRAGRCRPGICYHLFGRKLFYSMQKFQVPEILRVPIHELCLQAKLLAPPNVPIADFLARAPDPPPFMVTRNAITLLKTIDALDPWEELSELGIRLLDLPIEPRLGKMIMYSVVLKCLDPVLTIVSALAYKDPFLLPLQPSQKKTAILTKKKLACNMFSDHLALLRAFQLWQKAKREGYEHNFCSRNFLSVPTMEMIFGLRMQLLGLLRASGFVRIKGGMSDLREYNTNADVWPVVRAAICAGTYPNLIRVDRERQQLITQKDNKVRFHSSSVLSKFPLSSKDTVASLNRDVQASLPSDWLIYEEMSRVGHVSQAHCCTLVTPITVALFAGPSRLPLDALHDGMRSHGGDKESDSEDEDNMGDCQKSIFKLDDWVSFKIDSEIARLALQLRQKWHALLLRKINMPYKPWSQADDAVIRTITTVLIAEEEDTLRLTQPSGLAARLPWDHSIPGSSHQYVNHPPPSTYTHPEKEIADANRMAFHATVGHRPMDKQRGYVFQHHKEMSDCSSVRSVDSGSVDTSPNASPGLASSTLNRFYRTHSHIRYYVIKAQHPKALDISFFTSTWTFTPHTERKLLASIKEGKDVVLIFSLQGSGHFQGVAKFTPHIADQRMPDPHQPNCGPFYYIEWLKRGNLPFQSTQHLHNTWNENKKVQISRDGQELEPSVGETLCRLWDNLMAPPSIHPPVENKVSQPITSSRWYNPQSFGAVPKC